MKNINFLSLDLEMAQPSGKIIQVGAVIGNLASGEILTNYSAHIKINEDLSDYIIKLTGIKQRDVDNGISLDKAYEELKDIHKQYDCFRNCLTWGGGDSQELRTQLDLDEENFLFGRRWIDVKTVYIAHRMANNQGFKAGLAKALNKFELNFEGRKHNAMWDALNTFYIYRKLLMKIRNNNFIKIGE